LGKFRDRSERDEIRTSRGIMIARKGRGSFTKMQSTAKVVKG
jgi:hypothetical protein